MEYLFLGLGGFLVFIVLAFILYASRVVTAGPNEALIISGRTKVTTDAKGERQELGFRVVKGGNTFVWPIIERCERMSLELITLDIKTPEVVTKRGVPIRVEGVAQIKIKGEMSCICTAAEQFLGKSRSEIMDIAMQTLEGHLRAILGDMDVEDLISKRDAFASKVQDVSGNDLANMGLCIVSFTIKDIRDEQGYLDALGKKRIAEVQRDAAIGQSEASRDAEIKRAQAQAEALEKSSEANQRAQVAKYQAETKVAEGARDKALKVQSYEGEINQKKAEADGAYDLQKYKVNQSIKQEEMQVQVIEKQKAIEIQDQEIKRRERELTATVERPAEAEKKKVELLASAEQFKLKATADGEAEATRKRGLARADVERAEGTAMADVQKAKGMAEAEVIQAKGMAEAEVARAVGLAEAEAMEKKAKAWQAYNDAAISQMFIEKLPEIVRAVAEPLAKTDKITIVSTGGDGMGASRVTKDILDIVAQVPPLLEGVSGVNLKEMLGKIHGASADERNAAKEPPKPPKPPTPAK